MLENQQGNFGEVPMKVAKKNGSARKTTTDPKAAKREELRKEYTNKGPLRLRKFAITGLNIPSETVDEWNDFNYIVDYCVAKSMGEPLPEAGGDNGVDAYEESNEFDATSMVDGNGSDGDSDFDSEMEDGSEDDMFGGGEEEPEETEEEPEPTPPPKTEKKSSKLSKCQKPKTQAPPPGDGDVDAQLQGMLDVITNQGVILDNLQNAVLSQKSTIEEIYIRQEATHRAITGVAKTVWQISTFVSEFIPRALKAMRYKPQVTKDIKGKAEAAAKAAEGAIAKLLDPEAD